MGALWFDEQHKSILNERKLPVQVETSRHPRVSRYTAANVFSLRKKCFPVAELKITKQGLINTIRESVFLGTCLYKVTIEYCSHVTEIVGT